MEMDDKQLVVDIFTMVSTGDYTRLRELIAEDYIDHGPMGDVKGPDGFRQLVDTWRASFSDLEVHPEAIIVEGDMAAWRVVGSGTHTGEFMGVPPTGKRVTFAGIDQGRRRDGQAVEHWSSPDFLGLLVQLGVVPAPVP
jgi:predicted ester cyclase